MVGDTKAILALMLVILPIMAGAESAGEPLRSISAGEVLSKIKSGMPVEYDHVIIMGDLKLKNLDLPRKKVIRSLYEIDLGLLENMLFVKSSIRINDSIIKGELDFNNSILEKSVDFENTDFDGPTSFMGAQFNESATFKGCQFNRSADFRRAQFSKYGDFSGARFSSRVDFTGSKFNGRSLHWEAALDDAYRLLSNKSKETIQLARSKLGESANYIIPQLKAFAVLLGTKLDRAIAWAGEQAKILKVSIILKADETMDFVMFRALELATFLADELDHMIKLTADQLEALMRLLTVKLSMAYSLLIIHSKRLVDFTVLKSKEVPYIASWAFHTYGTKLKSLFSVSAILVVLFGFFWRAIGFKVSEKISPKGRLAKEHSRKGSSKVSRLHHQFALFIGAIGFSAAVFLSGTKIFINPPKPPEQAGRLGYLARGAFTLERLLGAMFSILFFIALSRV